MGDGRVSRPGVQRDRAARVRPVGPGRPGGAARPAGSGRGRERYGHVRARRAAGGQRLGGGQRAGGGAGAQRVRSGVAGDAGWRAGPDPARRRAGPGRGRPVRTPHDPPRLHRPVDPGGAGRVRRVDRGPARRPGGARARGPRSRGGPEGSDGPPGRAPPSSRMTNEPPPPARRDVLIPAAVGIAVVVAFVLIYPARGYRIPLGSDTPVYVWWARLAGTVGLGSFQTGTRPGIVGLLATLAHLTGRPVASAAEALTPALAAALALAAAVVTTSGFGRTVRRL